MVSIDTLRDELLKTKYEERSLSIASRKRKLRELYAVVRYVDFKREFPQPPQVVPGQPMPPYLSWEPSDEAERRFLEGNDISRGLYYDERTLPISKPAAQQIEAPAQNGAVSRTASPKPAPPSAPSPSQLPLTPAPSAEELSSSQERRHSIDSGRPVFGKEHHPPSPVEEPSDIGAIRRRSLGVGHDGWQNETSSETTTITPPQEPQPEPISPKRQKSEDQSAPISVIGGVPVIQSSLPPSISAQSKGGDADIVAGPDAAVHPPPPPSEKSQRRDESSISVEIPRPSSGASSLPSPLEPVHPISTPKEAAESDASKPLETPSISTHPDPVAITKDALEPKDHAQNSLATPTSAQREAPSMSSGRPSLEDPNAQLRMEMEMSKKTILSSDEDVQMKDVSKLPAVEAVQVLEKTPVPLSNIESSSPAINSAVEEEKKKAQSVELAATEQHASISSDGVQRSSEKPTQTSTAPTPVPVPIVGDVEMRDADLTEKAPSLANKAQSEDVQSVSESSVSKDQISLGHKESASLAADNALAFDKNLAHETVLEHTSRRPLQPFSPQRANRSSQNDPVFFEKQKYLLKKPKDAVGRDVVEEANKAISLFSKTQPKTEEPVSLLRLLFTIDSSASLQKTLQASHKVLNTRNHALAFDETIAQRVITRVLQLQDAGKWSLRQPPRVPEPKRRECHWDFLIKEALWMREDFREERKWKLATARMLAHWAKDWYDSSPEDRKALQVKVSKPISRDDNDRAAIEDAGEAMAVAEETEPVPKVEQQDSEAVDLDLPVGTADRDEPFELFSIFESSEGRNTEEDAVFAKPSFMEDLPLFAPPRLPSPKSLEEGVDQHLPPIAPVNKFLTTPVVVLERPFKRKRGRFEYEPNTNTYADDSDDEEDLPVKKRTRRAPEPPEESVCSLFNPGSKAILNRAAAANPLKPPSAPHIPPPTFFTSRAPSQWTLQDDELLKEMVQQYPQNWALISTALTPKGEFHSSVERRSPWECFERHISMLDSIPPEFSKNQFYRGIQQRLEMAQKGGEVYVSNSGQGSGQNTPTIKRKGTMPIRIDRKRNTRALHLIEAMRKLAKKRETAVNKQHNAPSRRVDPANQPKTVSQTPLQFSKMKYEKELRQQEMLRQQQQLQAQRQALLKNNPAALQQLAAQQQLLKQGAVPHPQAGQHVVASAQANGLVPPQVNRTATAAGMPHLPNNVGVPTPNMGHNAAMNHNMVPAMGAQMNNLHLPPNIPQERLQALVMQQKQMSVAQKQMLQKYQEQQQQQHQQGNSSSPVPLANGLPINYSQHAAATASAQAHLLQQQQQQQAQAQQAALASQVNGHKPGDQHGPSASPHMHDNPLPPQVQMGPWLNNPAAPPTQPQQPHNQTLPPSSSAQASLNEYHRKLVSNLINPNLAHFPQHHPGQPHPSLPHGQQPSGIHAQPNFANMTPQQQQHMYSLHLKQIHAQQAAQRAQQAAVAAATGHAQRSNTPAIQRPGSVGNLSAQQAAAMSRSPSLGLQLPQQAMVQQGQVQPQAQPQQQQQMQQQQQAPTAPVQQASQVPQAPVQQQLMAGQVQGQQ